MIKATEPLGARIFFYRQLIILHGKIIGESYFLKDIKFYRQSNRKQSLDDIHQLKGIRPCTTVSVDFLCSKSTVTKYSDSHD